MGARADTLVRRLGYWVGVFIAALVGGMIGAVPVGTLGLAVPLVVILPLALIAGVLLSGICAGWAARLLAPDRTRSILLPISSISVAIGAVVVAASFDHLFSTLSLFVAIIAVGGSIAAWQLRPFHGRLTRDLLTTLGLLGVLVVMVLGTVVTTCSVMRCGP